MVSNIIAGTVSEFIDYAILFTTLLLIYYFIKLFTVEGLTKEEKEAEAKERKEAFGKWTGEKKEKYQKTKEAAVREKLLKPVKGFLLRIENEADEATEELDEGTAGGLNKAKSSLDKIKSNLRSTRKILRAVRAKVKGEKRDYINNLSNYVQTMEELTQDHIQACLPTSTADPQWKSKITGAKAALKQLTARCGVLIVNIDKFIEEEKVEILGTTSPQSIW